MLLEMTTYSTFKQMEQCQCLVQSLFRLFLVRNTFTAVSQSPATLKLIKTHRIVLLPVMLLQQ